MGNLERFEAGGGGNANGDLKKKQEMQRMQKSQTCINSITENFRKEKYAKMQKMHKYKK